VYYPTDEELKTFLKLCLDRKKVCTWKEVNEYICWLMQQHGLTPSNWGYQSRLERLAAEIRAEDDRDSFMIYHEAMSRSLPILIAHKDVAPWNPDGEDEDRDNAKEGKSVNMKRIIRQLTNQIQMDECKLLYHEFNPRERMQLQQHITIARGAVATLQLMMEERSA